MLVCNETCMLYTLKQVGTNDDGSGGIGCWLSSLSQET